MAFADPLTLVLVGFGGVGLVLWYTSRSFERRREINFLVEGNPIMAQKNDRGSQQIGARSAQLMNDLPARLDPGWMEHQAEQSIAVFKATPGLFENWLLTLRDRYRTPLEIEIYENAEKKLRARMSFLKTAIEADVAATTAREQHDIQTLKVKTEHVTAKRDYAIASGTADISVENKLMAAQLENETLRRQLEEARAASTSAHRPLVETREAIRNREREEEAADAAHTATLAYQRAQKAKHEADARGYRRPQREPKASTDKAPPPPVNAAERRALLLRAEELKVQAINKADMRARKELDELKQEYGADSEEYNARDAYWNSRLIELKERRPETFLGAEDCERLNA